MPSDLEALHVCEECGDMLTESEANVETAQGYREVIVLAFCDDCYSR